METVLVKWISSAGTDIPVIQVIKNVCCCFSLGITFKHFPNNCSLLGINIELPVFIYFEAQTRITAIGQAFLSGDFHATQDLLR